MADQRDVQQLIQGLVPASGNAGNPNTAYNNAATDPWLLGYTGVTVPEAASLPGLNLSGSSETVGAVNIAPLVLAGQQSSPWNRPTTSAGVTLPVFQNNPGAVNPNWGVVRPTTPTNPVVPPTVQPNPVPVDVPIDTGLTIDWGDLLEPLTPPAPGRVDNSPLAGAILGNQPGTGSYPIGGQLWNPYNLGTTVGVGDGGDFLQFVDMVTEPLLSGDFYKSGTGKWDFKGAGLDAIANIAGIPAGTIDKLLGLSTGGLDRIIDKADSGQQLSVLEQLVLDRWRAGVDNELALTQQDINKKLDNNVNAEAQRISEAVNQAALGVNTPAAPRRSSQSAGATTIAEGAAAQEMFEGMRTNRLDPLGYNAMFTPEGRPRWMNSYTQER